MDERLDATQWIAIANVITDHYSGVLTLAGTGWSRW
jgi:hypothetical protein